MSVSAHANLIFAPAVNAAVSPAIVIAQFGGTRNFPSKSKCIGPKTTGDVLVSWNIGHSKLGVPVKVPAE